MYAKPGENGGKLIRKVISTFWQLTRNPALKLPLTSHILIAVSGGCDSMALAKLMVQYGRRVGAAKKIRLVHINHGWRGKESDGDETFVRAAGRRWGVPVSVFHLKPQARSDRRSPEEFAREERKRIFGRLSKKYSSVRRPAWIFTAHHADDLAETLIWRFFTGTLDTHGAGITFQQGQEIRPFLRVRKKELVAFLKEEGEEWREDRTNFEGQMLRSRMRLELMTMVEKIFPRAVEHLSSLGAKIQERELSTQGSSHSSKEDKVDASVLFSAAGLRVRRAHWNWLNQGDKAVPRRLALPGGWVLRRELDRSSLTAERWILERK